MKEYRQLNHDSQVVHDDGVFITFKTLVFDCRIPVFDRIQSARLYFNTEGASWFMVL